MSSSILITLCCLLLLAYVFDLTASKTRIPAVILLLLLGWVVRQFTDFIGVMLPDMQDVLSILGTVGLILIVLEGALDLELGADKKVLIRKSILMALFPLFILSFALAFVLQYFTGASLQMCLANAIPLSVISSSIAIPTARNLPKSEKEFVIYESSMSDILGVLFFNFIVLNDIIDLHSFGEFGLQLLIIIFISILATITLAILLKRIQHQIKFAPIILLLILIYVIAKEMHLPALLLILFFGLFIGNLDELKRFSWIQRLNSDSLSKEVVKFKELTTEATFLVRAVFFLLFGYLMDTKEIINTETLKWSGGIVIAIFLIRAIQLRIFKLPLKPLVFIAPRGLITILLFLTILPEHNIPMVNTSLIIQVIILTALILMVGMMISTKSPSLLHSKTEESEKEESPIDEELSEAS
ncbi:MAG: sodium:proton antiporter [Bacteroidetes bacterium]|nr:sodium:proton antiporter [Bacteroidota bacterium]MBP7398927.1 hypothetical protein [Chitinophagales bacterium]MBK8682486.1 sodium:proton antiporter [Bacteroidota bacterium]MBP8753463.1 hypothetical protein [Chitinophagales bacterium]MBP9188464.1 hypothetical protein [Chitinophagales bacterium]